VANEDDLVSNVRIEGTEEANAKLDTFAQKGAAAFEKIDKAAAGAAAGVAASATQIQAAGAKAGQGLNNVVPSGFQSRLKEFGSTLGDVQSAISNVTSKFPALITAVGRFTARMATAGAAAAAAGAGLAIAARNIAKSVDGQSTALEDNAKAQTQANDRMLEGQVAAINLAADQRKLLTEYAQGKITLEQYQQGIIDSNNAYREQQVVANEVANAQERVRLANERLQKQVADQKAFNELIDKFGGPLLTSLTAFGRSVEQVRVAFVQTLGPSVAKVFDLIDATITKNFGNIQKFFNDAASKIDNLVKTQGPALQTFAVKLATLFGSIFNALIDGAPGILDFFNNKLFPALEKIGNFFSGLATVINSVFGTNISAGGAVVLVLFAQMTGSIRLMISLLGIFKASWAAVGGVIEAVGGSLGVLFGRGAAVTGLIRFGSALTSTGGILKTFLSIARSGIPIFITLAEVVAAAFGISFGAAAIAIAAVTAALIFLLSKVDWNAFLARAQAAIIGVVNFFKQLGQGAVNIAQAVSDAWTLLIQTFTDLGTQIGGIFTAAWQFVMDGVTATVKFVTDTWNSIVDFFKGLVDKVSQFFVDLGTRITTAISGAIDTVKGFFAGLLADAKAKLQPILDLLNAIASLVSSALGGGELQGAQGFAGGGHIRGPGTGTSDSIPIWASAGEFMVKAKSVAKYGLGMLHAINNGTLRVPKFNIGGLISSSMASVVPRLGYASGGEIATPPALRPLSLTLFGEQFSGLLAPEDVGERLTKFAVAKGNRSAGRKPAWVGKGRN
jgi:phage-related protein